MCSVTAVDSTNCDIIALVVVSSDPENDDTQHSSINVELIRTGKSQIKKSRNK